MVSPYPPPNAYQPEGQYQEMPANSSNNYSQQQPMNYGNQNGGYNQGGYGGGGGGYGQPQPNAYDQQMQYQQQANMAGGMNKYEQQPYQPQSAGMDGKFDDMKPKYALRLVSLFPLMKADKRSSG